MEFWDSLDSAERLERESVRSAIVLAKIRYDEQLAPFVKNDAERLSSDLVQRELRRIIAETAEEVGADETIVAQRLQAVLADVVLPVSEPERESLTEGREDSLPPAKDADSAPEPQATTDVRDHGAVLEDEILEPEGFKRIEVQGCFRCNKREAASPSPLCESCEDEILKAAGFLDKEADAYGGGYATPSSGTQAPPATAPSTVIPQQQPGQQPMTALNPNAPYQCNVCGYTGSYADVQQHLNTASDANHMQAKQNQHIQQPQGGGVVSAKKVLADSDDDSHGAYYDDIHKDDVKEPDTQQDPASHFDSVVQEMANRAAARQLSSPTDQDTQSISQAYGLDPDIVKKSLYIKADFGNYHGVNGVIGESAGEPEGYTPIDLTGTSGQEEEHEAVVPVNPAVRKVADDLGMDPQTIFATLKDNYGDDLANEYHLKVKGSRVLYLPREVMDQSTNHPEPQAPQDGQQQQPMQAQPGQQGTAVQPVQPMQATTHYLGGKLSQEMLDHLLVRDEAIAEQRMQRRGYVKVN